MSSLKERLTNAVKDAMRARDQFTLTTLRMAQAAIKQIEVDERIVVDDTRVLAILDKLIKQRREASVQFQQAGRTDLFEKEEAEIKLLQVFMPQALSTEEIHQLIDAAIQSCNAQGIKDMGKVMTELKPQLQGRADLGQVSQQIKQRLS